MNNEKKIDLLLQETEIVYGNEKQIHQLDWFHPNIPEQSTSGTEHSLFRISKEAIAALYIAQRCKRTDSSERGNADDTLPLQVDAIIETFAKKHSFWIDNTDAYFHNLYDSPISFGSESNVYLDANRKLVVKTIDTEIYGSILKALQRFVIHNTLFPETSLNVTGFGRSRFGLFEIIAEQPYIEGRFATIEEISQELERIGAINQNGDFIIGNFFISDIKPKNAIINIDKKIFIIDSYLELLTK